MEEYLSPEDKAALIEFAGPIFAQAKYIDANSVDKDGYRTSRHALEIQSALERDFQQKSAPMHYSPPPVPTQPIYAPAPAPIDYAAYGIPPAAVPTPMNVIDYGQNTPPRDPNQLEFSFNQTEQEKTNAHLEEISRKLTKLINLLQEKPAEHVTKLKTAKDPVPKIS